MSAAGSERVIEGLGVAPGIAIGPAFLVEGGAPQAPEYTLAPEQVEPERARFAAAVEKSRVQVLKLKGHARRLPAQARAEIHDLLDAYQQMLGNSRLVRGVGERIGRDQQNAEAAVRAEVAGITSGFEAIPDPYFAARIQEIREVGHRLVRNLTDTPYRRFANLPVGTILIAEELTPADTALLDPAQVSGVASVLGGAEGHTAIMARALGLPAVLGANALLGRGFTARTAIVDGDKGRVILDPSPETLAVYTRGRDAQRAERRRLAGLSQLPAVTRDGEEVRLLANLELPREAATAVELGAEGVGLLRTEFLFMNRDDLPSEDEQHRQIASLVRKFGKPVTVRTLDVGGEKIASALSGEFGGGTNPALGLRAIRLSLELPSLLETQLSAILRAGARGPVRILLPMVTTADEVLRVREALIRVARRLKRRRVKLPPVLPPVGVMIEVPGAALAADALAVVSDFFALGTNDLTMYTLAIDRGDERVAHLYNPLHPAVLRLIRITAEAALRARIPVSVCGEMAGDPRYTALLLGLGIRELSMAPINLPRVKARIRAIDLAAATQRAAAIMDQSDPVRIAALLDEFNASL